MTARFAPGLKINKVDHKDMLSKLVRERKLPQPIYNSCPVEEEKGFKYFKANVKIADHTYVSSSMTFKTALEAEDSAAKAAINELKDIKLGPPIDNDDPKAKDIIDNIYKIVSKDPKQIWRDIGIVEQYQKIYYDRLPENWVDLIGNCDGILEVEEKQFYNKKQVIISVPIKQPTKKNAINQNTLPVKLNNLSLNDSKSNQDNSSSNNSSLNSCELNSSQSNSDIANSAQNTSILNNNTRQDVQSNNSTPDTKCQNIESSMCQNIESSMCRNIESSMCQNSDLSACQSSDSSMCQNSDLSACQNVDSSVPGDDVVVGGKTREISSAILPKICPEPKSDVDYYDVLVTLSVRPDSFYVVSYTSYNGMYKELVSSMNNFYEKQENQFELNPQILAPRDYVAVKYNNTWHRGMILKIDSDCHILCYLVDLGNIQLFSLQEIQPLYSCFRNLPKQAIKARLFGLKPKTVWDNVSCFEFRKMVENKGLVAMVHDIIYENNPLDDSLDPVIILTLFDTSTQSDILIAHELINKGYAIPSST